VLEDQADVSGLFEKTVDDTGRARAGEGLEVGKDEDGDGSFVGAADAGDWLSWRGLRGMGSGFLRKELAGQGVTQDAQKWDKFVPLFEVALQWNQALESLFVGQLCPTLDPSVESRNCSQSDYPARGADDDSEGGREPAHRHENRGEDFSRGCVNEEERVLGYSNRVTSRPRLRFQFRGFVACPRFPFSKNIRPPLCSESQTQSRLFSSLLDGQSVSNVTLSRELCALGPPVESAGRNWAAAPNSSFSSLEIGL
jgi:hypothetical protein